MWCAGGVRREIERHQTDLTLERRDLIVAATKQQAPLEEAKRQSSSRPCYLHLSAHKLRELVKGKTTFNPEHLAAIDEAWFHTFGVLLVLQDCESVEARETVLGVEQVLRMSNLSLTSLKRHMLDGKFPRPHRSSPDRIGWRPGDVSAWLHQRGSKRCSGSTTAPSCSRRPKGMGWKALFRSARREPTAHHPAIGSR